MRLPHFVLATLLFLASSASAHASLLYEIDATLDPKAGIVEGRVRIAFDKSDDQAQLIAKLVNQNHTFQLRQGIAKLRQVGDAGRINTGITKLLFNRVRRALRDKLTGG